jgi:multidrug resistance efflux pump
MAALRAQSDRLAADLKDTRSAPAESTAAADLQGINQRIEALERATRAQGAEIAQAKAKENAQADAKPADDVPLRRIVASSLLDVLVRFGDP